MPNRRKINQLLLTSLPGLFTSALLTPTIWRLVDIGYDYRVHLAIAATMTKSGAILTPHFLFQTGVILLAPLTGSLYNAAIVLMLLSEMALALILAKYLLTVQEPSWRLAVMIPALLVAAPVALLYPLDGHLYLGYIGINLLHNPTMFLLKPLALLSFIYTVKSLETTARLPVAALCVSTLLTIAAALAKPSYTIVILPALAIYLTGTIIRKRQVDWYFPLFSIFVPAIIILLLQYRMNYGSDQAKGVYNGTNQIIFSPLTVMTSFSLHLWPKLLLSFLFPISVLFADFRRAVRDIGLQLAWLVCGIGCFYTYFLAESGPRMYQGNFTWSAQVALFILFAVSARFLLQNWPTHSGERMDWRRLGCIAVLILHMMSGLAFIAAEFVQPERYW